MSFNIISASDTAIVIEFGDAISPQLNDMVLAADAAISECNLTGIVETVPTFRSLMIHYDPRITTARELEAALLPLVNSGQIKGRQTRTWQLPVCYQGEYAPDLRNIADLTGVSSEQVISLHTATPCHIYMIGFLPGQPYIGGLAEPLHLPRLSTPRVRVPRGSVAIATGLSTIYPYESPGGWHLIGTTPVSLFDKDRPKPALFSPGDNISFQPVDVAEFKAIEEGHAKGQYTVPCEEISS